MEPRNSGTVMHDHFLLAHRARDRYIEAALYHPALITYYYPTERLLTADNAAGDTVSCFLEDDTPDHIRTAVRALALRLFVRAALRRGMRQR